MILISHKGNLNGPDPANENSPALITNTLQRCQVEADVWYQDQFYLGHDQPQYLITEQFLLQPGLWLHAKNPEALEKLLLLGVHCFWHQQDDRVLTSKNYIWTYPGKEITGGRAIAVMPELFPEWDISKAIGVCSDYLK